MYRFSYLAVFVIFIFYSCTPYSAQKVKFQGEAQGTYYIVTYFDETGRNFQAQIDSLLADFDLVASMWVDSSYISKVNRNEDLEIANSDFRYLYQLSKRIFEKSNEAFDPTVGPLVNAWGFGFKDRMKVDENVVDSLLQFIGFNRVSLENGKIIKSDDRVQFDFNAIAQGYSVDLVGEFLEGRGIKNYLIDIGGEVLGRGHKPNDEVWKVGIEKPADNAAYGESMEAIIKLENKAMATSGNYRKFYEENGIRYSHTIDPKTGYPVHHSILSVSVMADNCAEADAWATAFMVMGLEKSVEVLGKNKDLDAFFIYSGATDGTYQTYYTNGFEKIIIPGSIQ